jgi:hypothetical protein
VGTAAYVAKYVAKGGWLQRREEHRADFVGDVGDDSLASLCIAYVEGQHQQVGQLQVCEVLSASASLHSTSDHTTTYHTGTGTHAHRSVFLSCECVTKKM